jgi:hypothetical protein
MGSGRAMRRQERKLYVRRAESDELRTQYRCADLGSGVRRKSLKADRAGTNLALLSPDVARAFPTEEAVTNALRSLMEVAKRFVGPRKDAVGGTKTQA